VGRGELGLTCGSEVRESPEMAEEHHQRSDDQHPGAPRPGPGSRWQVVMVPAKRMDARRGRPLAQAEVAAMMDKLAAARRRRGV